MSYVITWAGTRCAEAIRLPKIRIDAAAHDAIIKESCALLS